MATFNELKDKVSNFSLKESAKENQGFTHILVQLFGFLGHGKSSFINTCKYVVDDKEFKTYADAKFTYGGNTKCRLSYPLTKTITLVDNRGCATLSSYETGEIFAQLGNLLPLNQKVDWEKGFNGLAERIVKADTLVKSSDLIYPVFVYSVKTGINPDEIKDIKKILGIARDLTGIFPFVVLTNKTSGDLAGVETAFKQMGVEHYFSLENFTPEDKMKTRGRFEDVLGFFNDIIEDVKFHLERLQDPEKERVKRKEFVLKYIHDMEVIKRQEEIEKQKARDKALHEKEIRRKEAEINSIRKQEGNLLQQNQQLKEEIAKKKKSKNKCETH